MQVFSVSIYRSNSCFQRVSCFHDYLSCLHQLDWLTTIQRTARSKNPEKHCTNYPKVGPITSILRPSLILQNCCDESMLRFNFSDLSNLTSLSLWVMPKCHIRRIFTIVFRNARKHSKLRLKVDNLVLQLQKAGTVVTVESWSNGVNYWAFTNPISRIFRGWEIYCTGAPQNIQKCQGDLIVKKVNKEVFQAHSWHSQRIVYKPELSSRFSPPFHCCPTVSLRASA